MTSSALTIQDILDFVQLQIRPLEESLAELEGMPEAVASVNGAVTTLKLVRDFIITRARTGFEE